MIKDKDLMLVFCYLSNMKKILIKTILNLEK